MNIQLKKGCQTALRACVSAEKKTVAFFKLHEFLRCIILALLTLLISESLCRHSLVEAFNFIIDAPYAFFYNFLIILTTISLSLFCPKKGFAATVIIAGWLILSLVNCIVLSFRITPFSAIDFSIAINMLGIIDIYLNLFQLSLIIIGIAAFITLLIYIWKKNPTSKIDFFLNSVFAASIAVILLVAGIVGTNTGLLSRKFPHLGQAYKDYGFAYCFTLSIFDVGINQPEQYTFDTVESILQEIDGEDKAPAGNPNIIIVQLESFFDINRVTNLVTDSDPVPNLTYLKKNYPHGLITVPSIGGGTANTEFEIITGMNLDHFGPGEYPYKTILKNTTCETPAFTLKKFGYSSHAIHNHTATFYSRNTVYANLGFDTFIPVELMHNVERNALGWAKDAILTEQILDCITSTEGRDFVFTVSVQPHGKYPDEELEDDTKIKVDLQNITDAEKEAQYTYYVSQLHDTDAFVGSLMEAVSNLSEPTAILFYGDHFPTIYLEDDKLIEGSKYQTDWAIWANYDIKCENANMNTYQLVAHFFKALDCNPGTTVKLHQTLASDENYQNKLEMLEYDMLYGERITFDGENPYIRTNIEIGLFDIYITELQNTDTLLYIHGSRFNEYTKVKIDGRIKDTILIDENCIVIENIDIEKYKTIQLVQLSHDREELRSSAEYLIENFFKDIPPHHPALTNENNGGDIQ